MFKFIDKLLHPLRARRKYQVGHRKTVSVMDGVTIGIMSVALVLLAGLIWYNVRPLKLLEIKVPVATDQSSYSQGEEISGLFFGESFYTGHVKILREVYCKDYKGVIKPPAESAEGDFFSSRVEPTKYEGTSRRVGNLPDNVPVGSNCVLKFLNIYEIQTPFGIRKETVEYYTQNFAIISKERRAILDCEAETGQTTEQCEVQIRGRQATDPKDDAGSNPAQPSSLYYPQEPRTAPQSNGSAQNGQSPSSTSSEPETPVNEPITPPVTCGVDILFIHLFCR